MGLFAMEHGKAAYQADFALYGVAVAALATFLFTFGPHALRLESLALVCVGLVSWTAIEYLLHRFVLHGLAPFKGWHEEHHQRPTALICAPTILSASLILALVFLPVLALGGIWNACALTLGMLTGYLLYAITHHATHHWPAESAWLKRRKRWHALHHHDAGRLGGFGVTSALWDHVFGSAVSRTLRLRSGVSTSLDARPRASGRRTTN
jgi:sterol desaturase/sphingolipid hydroxylase (fatty acid hydroxylase superfamily)